MDWTNPIVSQSTEERERLKCMTSSLNFLYGCVSELPMLGRGPSGVPPRMPLVQRWRMRFQLENFPTLMIRLLRLHLSK